MEKSRFDIISDLFKLSNVISGSLKLAESLADKSSGSDETDCKDICRNIRYSLKRGGLPEHGSHKAILLSRKRTGASIAGRF